jgi:hypothetical protein
MKQTRFEVAFYNKTRGWITDCAFDRFRGALRYIVDVTAALANNDKPQQARVIHSETREILAQLQVGGEIA